MEPSEDSFQLEDIQLEEFYEAPGEVDEEETLEAIQSSVKKVPEKPELPVRPPQPAVASAPIVVEDYIRNYLKKMGMTKTLQSFQDEWYESAHDSSSDPVVDSYAQIQELDEQVLRLQTDLQTKEEFAKKATVLFEKLRKERDFHKMHHRRVVEEKNRLIKDMKRLVRHNAHYEPALAEMKSRYESAMKDKM
ncbi:MAG: putative WD-repeat protein, partial [Streblomastix strix]